MAPPRTEFGSEYRRHVTRIGTFKRKTPEAAAEDASFLPNPRNVHRHIVLQLLRESLLEHDWAAAADAAAVLAVSGAMYARRRTVGDGSGAATEKDTVTFMTEQEGLLLALELLLRANPGQLEGGVQNAVRQNEVIVHLRMLMSRLPFGSRVQEETRQELAIYLLTHSADPLLALQELAAPVAPEKKLAAVQEPHRSHLRLRCAARGLLLHHLWASSLAKHCARVRALPAPNQAAGGSSGGGGGGGGGGDAGKRRRNEGSTAKTAETSGRVFATAHTLKGNAVAAESDTSRLVVEFRGQAIHELEKAVEHFPADTLLALTLSQLYASDKRPDAAATALRRSVDAAGEQADAHTLLAMWHESLGVPEAAAEKAQHFTTLSQCYLTALKYDPGNGFALEGLVHLESAGKCHVAVVVAHIAEYLDICGHLESSSVDGAWEALAQRLPKLSLGALQEVRESRQWWLRAHFDCAPGSAPHKAATRARDGTDAAARPSCDEADHGGSAAPATVAHTTQGGAAAAAHVGHALAHRGMCALLMLADREAALAAAAALARLLRPLHAPDSLELLEWHMRAHRKENKAEPAVPATRSSGRKR